MIDRYLNEIDALIKRYRKAEVDGEAVFQRIIGIALEGLDAMCKGRLT